MEYKIFQIIFLCVIDFMQTQAVNEINNRLEIFEHHNFGSHKCRNTELVK